MSVQFAKILLTASLVSLTAVANALQRFENNMIVTTGDPVVPDNQFYGYESSTKGPGDDAFQKCVNLAREKRRPLVVIWCEDGSSAADVFVRSLSVDNWRAVFSALTREKCIYAFFRGSKDSPAAVKEAYEFQKNTIGNTSTASALFGVWAEYENGVAMVHSDTFPSSGGWEKVCNAFFDDVKKWREEYEDNYDDNLVSVTCEMPSRLEALAETQSVFVPFRRTDKFDTDETDYLEVTYPDGTIVTNTITWTANGVREQEVAVPMTDEEGAPYWSSGAKVKLALMGAKGRINGKAAQDAAIACVAAANAPTFPSISGKEVLAWGEWTSDGVAATAKVYAANNYLQPDTNATPFAVEEYCRLTESGAWSNRYEVVYTNELAFFAPPEEIVGKAELVLVASNLATTVYTDESPLPAAETNDSYQVAVSSEYDQVSNLVIRAAADLTTNFWDVVRVQGAFSVSVTNVTTYAAADSDHPVGTTNVAETTELLASAEVEVTNRLFKAWRDGDPAVAKICPSNLTWSVTNFNNYVFSDTDATNTVIESIVTTNLDVSTTNFISYLLVDRKGDVSFAETNFTENGAYDIAMAGTNWYYQVTTNVYQYGDERTHKDYKGRAEAGIQSALLRFTGGVVWDDDAIAFSKFLETNKFKDLCALAYVAPVLVETAEPGTGASLFSYNVASNGNSGAVNISRRGLSMADCAAYAPALTNAEPFKLELVRPDGTVVGVFAPYNEKGAYDTEKAVTENLARLVEFLKLLDDRSENGNNDPKTTTDAFAYGESRLDRPDSTLQMSDKVDVFKVTGVPANKAVALDLGATGSADAGVAADIIAGSAVVPPFSTDASGNGVWKFTAAQAKELYLKVQAWTNATAATVQKGGATEVQYIPTVDEASVCSGKVGFVSADLGVEAVKGERTFTIAVERTGYTGAATATVSVDLENSSVSPSCYTLVGFSHGQKTLPWEDLEGGRKTFDVKVKDVLWGADISNLVFTVSCTGAELDGKKSSCKLGLRQEDDPTDPLGNVAITAPSVAETLYVKEGAAVDFTVRRFGSGEKNVARGLASATLTAKCGRFDGDANRVEWGSYQTGERSLTYIAPSVDDKSGYRKDTVTLKAVGTNNVNVAVAASNKVSLCVLSSMAPGFVWANPLQTAVQYVEFEYTDNFDSKLLLLVPERAERISGPALPSGIKATVTATGLRFAGKPTKPTDCKTLTSTWWVRFKKVNETGRTIGYVYSMPVTFSIVVRALSESSGCGMNDAVNVGFATSRNWTDLPLTNGTGRLVGLLNLSATDKGAINARYRKLGGKTVAFPRAEIWVGGDDTVHANLASKDYACDVDFFKNLSVCGSVFDAETREKYGFFLPEGSEIWSKSHKATGWQGYYTIAFPKPDEDWHANTLCSGVPTVNARLTSSATALANGKATYAVTLPNGKALSGSAMLMPAAEEAEATVLPIFVSNSSETFAALVDVVTNAGEAVSAEKVFAVEGSAPYWAHTEPRMESASYSNGYSVVGVRFAGVSRKFDWTPYAFETEEGYVLKTKTINPTSGVVSGTMRDTATNRSISWKGVALPGLDESCPLVFGSFWQNVKFEGRSVRSGGAIRFVEAAE